MLIMFQKMILQESDFVGGSDQELNDSDYVAEPKEKKARKSAPASTSKVWNHAVIFIIIPTVL